MNPRYVLYAKVHGYGPEEMLERDTVMTRRRINNSNACVVGMDLSLARPAVCIIPARWELGKWADLWTYSFEPQIDEGATHAQKYERLSDISNRIRRFVNHAGERGSRYAPTDYFVEDYAFSASSSSVTRLAELGGVVRVDFYRRWQAVVRPVVASQARKQLLGRLPPKHAKLAVQQALYAHGAPFANDDECDAFVVANFGLSELGLTALSLA